MSGVKQTTIRTVTEAEYNRLLRQARQATTLSQANDALSRMNADNRTRLREYETRISGLNAEQGRLRTEIAAQRKADTARQNELRRQLADAQRRMDEAVAQQADSTRRQIGRMAEQLHTELSQVRRDAHDEIVASSQQLQQQLAETQTRLQQNINAVAADLNSRITAVNTTVTDLQGKMDAIESGNAALLQDAQVYRDTAGQLLQDTVTHFRAEQLVPGGRAKVDTALTTAAAERSTAEKIPGNASVARLTARQAYEAAVSYRNEVLAAELAWQQHYQAAAQALNAASAQLEASRTVRLGETPFDVDRWTNGELTRIGGELADLNAALGGTDSTADIAALDAIAAAAADRSAALEAAAAFAVQAVNASQTRVVGSAAFAKPLYEKYGLNFVAEDGGHAASYEGGDQRAAYRMHMKNPVTGFEVVITQTPVVQNGAIATRVESDVLSYGTISMAEADRTLRGILATLGLGTETEGSQVETCPGYEHRPSDRTANRNMNRWAAARPTTVATPDHKPAPAIPAPRQQTQAG